MNYLEELAENIRRKLSSESLLGPFAPLVKKVRNDYIHELYIKEKPIGEKLTELKKELLTFESENQVRIKNEGLKIEYDVDPTN